MAAGLRISMTDPQTAHDDSVAQSRRPHPHPHPPDRQTRTAAGPHRTQVGRLVSSGFFTHRVTTTPDPNPPSTSRGGDRDGAGAGGGGGRAFAGEVPAGGGDHDGRRGAAAGVHDLPQQALAVLLRRLCRRALFLLQADVGTRGSSDSDLLLPQWRCDGR